MSYFYKYTFVSPRPIFAIVKEELKSYFDTGAIDDLMFPTYVEKCLNKLGKSSYAIVPEIIYVEDFEARLPDNYFGVREAWLCTEIPLNSYRSASSFYSQAASETTIQISPVISNGVPCTNSACTTGCPECMPEIIQAVYKTNNEIARSYKKQYLLTPGNITVNKDSNLSYNPNSIPFSSSLTSFDIRDNKFVTNFRNGIVYLLMYTTSYDDTENQLIPDNYRVREYIEAFLKYKMFEILTNQINDETFNQLQQKMQMYRMASDEAYIMAENEIKKQDAHTKVNRIIANKNSLNKYRLPDNSRGYRTRGPYRNNR